MNQVEQLRERVSTLTPGTVEKPTLVYFNVIGIGWPIHCLLRMYGVDYEFIPILPEDWGARDESGQQILKPAFPNGHIPLYIDNEIKLNQSHLILGYLGDRFGMMGGSRSARYEIETVMSHAYDALFHWSGMLQVIIHAGIPEEVVQQRLDAFMGQGMWGIVSNGYRNNLNGFRNYLQANPSDSGYMVGDSLTVADLQSFNVLCNWYKAFDREVFESEYPDLDAYIRGIADIKEVRDYIDHHQVGGPWLPIPQMGMRLTSPDAVKDLV